MANMSLKCQCGEVRGTASNVSASSGSHVVCCCSDCQAFAQYLGAESNTLDEFGGTELFQMAQSQITIQQGQDKLQSMRLTQGGLLRWYTSCCNTPVANTINAKMPFAGVIHTFMDLPDRDSVLGPIRAVVQTQYAKGTPNYAKHSAKFPLGITLRLVRKILLWKIKGMHKPSVFFDDNGRPVTKPIIANTNKA